jgi:hypothetical protein
MSIMHYLATQVTSDPLVNAIDQSHTLHAGGTGFSLSGANFKEVQSAYTYVMFRDMWYSAPLAAWTRVSDELIEFDFPPLTEAFFDMVRSSSTNQQQIGVSS